MAISLAPSFSPSDNKVVGGGGGGGGGGGVGWEPSNHASPNSLHHPFSRTNAYK